MCNYFQGLKKGQFNKVLKYVNLFINIMWTKQQIEYHKKSAKLRSNFT